MMMLCVCVNRDSFDDLLPTLAPCGSRPDVDVGLSDQQQSAADGGEQWTAVNRR